MSTQKKIKTCKIARLLIWKVATYREILKDLDTLENVLQSRQHIHLTPLPEIGKEPSQTQSEKLRSEISQLFQNQEKIITCAKATAQKLM